MTPRERRARLRLTANESAMERHVLRALQGLQSDASLDWLTGTIRRHDTLSIASLPTRLAPAAALVRRTFADSYVAAQKEITTWRAR